MNCLIQAGLEKSAIFLLDKCPAELDVNASNRMGQSPLHLAALQGMTNLTQSLLASGCNPNLQTIFPGQDSSLPYRQTPLHLAIASKKFEVIHALLAFEYNSIKLDFDVKDSKGMTPLALSMSEQLYEVATELLQAGSNINVADSDGNTLLHLALMDKNCDAVLFLLENGADVNLRTKSNQTCLEMAIKSNLSSAVEALCRLGADMCKSSGPDPPLWTALKTDQDLASVLVRYGVDTDSWSEGPDGCLQTLLHRAIDENEQDLACFLIRCGCDLNSPRKAGLDGRGGDEAHDLASPLHLCCQWGLETVVLALLEQGANKNSKVNLSSFILT